MKHIKEHETRGERFAPPHARTIKHLAAPWTLGTRNLWMGISKVDPGSCSNLHQHDVEEEIFYVVSGRGRIRVGKQEEDIEPGSCVYIPVGEPHQLFNTGDETLKILASASPPFNSHKFNEMHKE